METLLCLMSTFEHIMVYYGPVPVFILKNVEISRVQFQRLKFPIFTKVLHIFRIFNLKTHQGPPRPQHIHKVQNMLHPPFLNS